MEKIERAMREAVARNAYKWCGKNKIARTGGGLIFGIYDNAGGTFVMIEHANLARIAGNESYLALTDLTLDGLSEQAAIFESELESLEVPLLSADISFSLRRLDLILRS